jgi:NAD(P)H-dependent FMN reductase
MSTLQVIVGSTRTDRAADKVVPWILDRAGRHPAFTVDLLDLRDWPLPLFQETLATIGDRADPTYSEPIVREWNRRVKQGDAFLFITPEYNHSVPGVLKNAIDSVFVSYAFRNKPAAMVGYSGSNVGGARAVEHLAHILIEAECVPLRNTVLVGGILQAFDAAGEPVNPLTDTALEIALDDLAWWTAALEAARAGGELLPGNRRMGAAMAAARSR